MGVGCGAAQGWKLNVDAIKQVNEEVSGWCMGAYWRVGWTYPTTNSFAKEGEICGGKSSKHETRA